MEELRLSLWLRLIKNWKISLSESVFAFGGLKLFRFHFGNLAAVRGEEM